MMNKKSKSYIKTDFVRDIKNSNELSPFKFRSFYIKWLEGQLYEYKIKYREACDVIKRCTD